MPVDVLSLPAPGPDAVLRWGALPRDVAEVRLPAAGSGRRPLLVLLHGGFWREAYDRRHLRPAADALAAAGWVVVLPEYRRTAPGRSGWPGALDDVAAAVDALPGLVADVAPSLVDPSRVVLAGHSAGGHLALWAASRHRLPHSAPWRRGDDAGLLGVVALAPVADLAAADALRLDAVGGPEPDDGAVAALLGGRRAEVPERFALADPLALAAAGPPAGTAVLVHGSADDRVPVELSRTYAAASGAALDLVDGADHFDVVDPRSAAWPRVLAALERVVGTYPRAV